MNSVRSKIKYGLGEILFPAIFFFLTFILIAYTRDLMLQQHGIYVSTVASAAIGAFIVAKVVVTIDLLPFMNPFIGRPLIYNVLWKAGVYFFATLTVRYLEHVIPFVIKSGDFIQGNQLLYNEIIWSRFWAVQIWLAVLFILYCALRELIRVLGRERVLHIFFGPSKSHFT